MPVQLFTEAERARRNRFPEVIAYEDLVTFFTLSEHDLEQYAALAVPPTTASAMPCNSVRCASWALCPTTSAVHRPKPWRLSPSSSPWSPTSWPPMAHARKPGRIICTAIQAHLGYRKARRKDLARLADLAPGAGAGA